MPIPASQQILIHSAHRLLGARRENCILGGPQARAAGNVAPVTGFLSQGLVASVTDALSHTTSYAYDAFGNLATVTDPAGNQTVNAYDIRGNKLTSQDPDMGTWNYAYDALGELIAQTSPQVVSASAGSTATWTYDTASNGVGLLASESTTAGNSKSFTYDGIASRPSTTTITVGGTNYNYGTTYNTTNGQIDTVSYPSGLALKYVYTGLGYLSQIKDAGSSLAYFTVNARDAELHLVGETQGNGVQATNTFDPSTGYLLNLRATASGGPANGVAAFDYHYDTAGDLLYRADENESVFETYCYDPLNRLTNYAVEQGSSSVACNAQGLSKSVAYDALGDITSKSDVGGYSYPASGSGSITPHAVSAIATNSGTAVDGVSSPAFGYDAIGDLVCVYASSGGSCSAPARSVSYTPFAMTAQIAQGSANSVSFAYDPDRARIQMTAVSGSNVVDDDLPERSQQRRHGGEPRLRVLHHLARLHRSRRQDRGREVHRRRQRRAVLHARQPRFGRRQRRHRRRDPARGL